MSRTIYTSTKYAIILSFVLTFVLSSAWAASYSDSVVMKPGRKSKHGTLTLVRKEVEAEIPKWSLDSYLNEQGLDKVKITCEMTEELINSNGGTYYQLTFDFGPSDVYFDVPLELTIQGKYVETDHDLVLLDPDGNPLEANKITGNGRLTFEIDHFSTYTYVEPVDEETYVEPVDEETIDNYEWASTYFASAKIGVKGGNININKETSVKITKNALAVYLDEQGEDSVVITVEFYYGWDDTLLFVFGPSGAHFEPELELTIKGGYIEDDMFLIGEDGEALEYRSQKKNTKFIFKIPHFSRYSYDHYDY